MVQILDSTLREGEQTPGVYFDNHIKLAMADLLDRIGVDIIEAGHPAVSQDIKEAIVKIAKRGLKAVVGAHSRSMRKDIEQAIGCDVGFIGVFYCVSNERLNGVHKKTLCSVIDDITDVISYAKERRPDIIIRYTPEDTVRSDFQNVLDAASAAVEAGADIISIADTTGYMIPGTDRNMYDYVLRLKDELAHNGHRPKIALHCHNDRGFALANAFDGYRAGADIIDASVLGLGERAGIVDLAQLLVTLKSDFHEGHNWDLTLLPQLYSLTSTFSNVTIPVNYPMTGKNAFVHCAGIHTSAATIDPLHYQSLDPKVLGRKTGICLDHMSGLSSVKYSLKKIGEPPNPALVSNVLKIVKQMGQKGKVIKTEELRYIVNMCKDKETPAQSI